LPGILGEFRYCSLRCQTSGLLEVKHHNLNLLKENNLNKYHIISIQFVLSIYLLLFTQFSFASDILKISGMGGISSAFISDDTGIFCNPASLLQCRNNVLSINCSIENFEYKKLQEKSGEQFRTRLNFLTQPSIYYSRVIGKTGFTLGILNELDTNALFLLQDTKSDYLVNERKFSADTDLLIDYVLLWEQQLLLGTAAEFNDLAVGTKIKFIRQKLKTGQRISSLNLESVHGREINPNDPRELIPAIIDSLDLGDPGKYISHEDLVDKDDLTTGFEIELGVQKEFNMPYLRDNKLLAGLLIENLIQYNLVKNHPTKIGIGFHSELTKWFETQFNFRRVSGSKGLDCSTGLEIHGKLPKWAKLGGALRSGIARVNSEEQFSVGFRITLGTVNIEYSLIKKFNEKLKNAWHLFASSVYF